MPEQNELPEGTDTIIAGASGSPGTDSTGGGAAAAAIDQDGDVLIIAEVEDSPAGGGLSGGSDTGGTSARGGGTILNKLRSGSGNLSGQAAERARGLVGQGLERGSETLGNVSRLIGDTAPGLEERLGPEFGDYARRAAGAIEDAANSLASKNPDELIDDTREFVRKSPGVALAGAAIVGFAIARLIKSGLTGASDGDQDRGRERGRSTES